MNEQNEILIDTLANCQGQNEQTDDILIMDLKI